MDKLNLESLRALDRYRSDFLFLLVGTNPLPNYVAARLLAVPSGRNYLVHTAEVGYVRGWLHERLTAAGFRCCPIEVHEANVPDIAGKIDKELKGLPLGLVGLNYTGGTKAMGVHAYRAIERALRDRQVLPVFSYLDARQLRLWVDPRDSAAPQSFDVGLAVKVDLRTLCALHGNPLRSDPIREPAVEKTAAILAREHTQESFVKAWRAWCAKQLRKADRPERFRSVSELKEICLPEEAPLRQVTDSFRGGSSAPSVPVTLEGAAQAAGLRHARDLAEWLDGKWLEHYTLGAIRYRLTPSCYPSEGVT